MSVLREGGRPTGLPRLWLATLNSMRGIQQCHRSEAAFRQEFWMACVLLFSTWSLVLWDPMF